MCFTKEIIRLLQWIAKLSMNNSIIYIDSSAKKNFIGNFLIALFVFLLILYSVSYGITAISFISNGLGACVVFLVAIIVFGWLCSPRFSLDNAKLNNLLILLILMIVSFNNNYNLKNGSFEQLAFFYTFFILSVFGAYSNIWHKHLLRIYIFFSSVFLIMTYVEILNPVFFSSTIMPKLFDAYSIQNHLNDLKAGYVSGISVSSAINVTVMMYGLAIFFALWLNSSNHKKKLFFCIITFLLTMFITGKRGPALFAIASLVYTFFYSKAENGYKKAVKFILIVLIVLLIFSIMGEFVPEINNTLDRFINKQSSGQDMSSGRNDIWEQTLNFFYSSPIVGIGWDSLKYIIKINAHNVYLQLLCEVGIFCSIVFFAFFGISFYHVNVAIRRMRAENRSIPPILNFSLIIQIYFLLYCFTGNPLYDAFALFGYLMSCSAGEYYYYQNQMIKVIYLPNKEKLLQ